MRWYYLFNKSKCITILRHSFFIQAIKNTEFHISRSVNNVNNSHTIYRKKCILYKKRRNIALKQLMFMFPFFSQHRAHKMGWNKSIATSLRILWRKFLYPTVYETYDTCCIKKHLNVSHKKRIRKPLKGLYSDLCTTSGFYVLYFLLLKNIVDTLFPVQ